MTRTRRIELCVWLALVMGGVVCAEAPAVIEMPRSDKRFDWPAVERVIQSAITDVRAQGVKLDEPLRFRVNGPYKSFVHEDGAGGYARSSSEVWIGLKPGMKAWDALRRCVAHELHHCARRRLVGYGRTLAEAIVSEGLADHFVVEVYGPPAGAWTRALNDSQFDNLRMKILADPHWKLPGAYSLAWLTGSRKRGIPRWTGYALGWRAVRDYLARHPGVRASRLAGAPALSILRGAGPGWGEDG